MPALQRGNLQNGRDLGGGWFQLEYLLYARRAFSFGKRIWFGTLFELSKAAQTVKIAYSFGRFLQVLALVTMPFAIWVGHIGHNERGAIIIFVGSVAVFCAGWFLGRAR
ncbi:MAG: hypothetical protein HY584_02135 [Candidatus Omnitrophica bacterium]|nr:hypothetical protein [Candidatus Omnitrophota bacterium]